MSEVAYKFTRAGARSPFTGFQLDSRRMGRDRGGGWPLRQRHPRLPRGGAARWIDEELWRLEVEDVHQVYEGVVVARRGRLFERIEAWGADTSRELARSCAVRARQLAEEHPDPLIQRMADDIAGIAEGPDPSATPLSMYCTAHAADVAVTGGYQAERRRQAE